MNAVAQTFAIALASVAAAAAIGIGLADSTAAPLTQVAPLEQQAASSATRVAQLPRVVVEGHRENPPEVTTVAQNRPARTL